MNFLWPALLGLTAFVGVPVAFHLLARRNAADSPFPTLRFLKEAKRRAGQGFRFRRLLLLLCRAGAVAALAVAMARPFHHRALAPHESAGRFAFVLDDSLSMRARAGTETLFERAKEEAKRRIAALEPADRAALFCGATPLTAGAVPKAEALAALAKAECSFGRFDPAAALEPAFRAVAGGSAIRRVTLLADFQKATYGKPLPADPAGALLATVDVKPAGASPRNLVPTRIALHPETPPAKAPCRLVVSLANPHDAPLEARLEVRAEGGDALLASESVPAFGEAHPAVELSFPAEGPAGGSVHLAAGDSLPEDDTLPFRVEVCPVLYALVLHPGPESGGFFARAALNPAGAADPARSLHVQAVDAEYSAARPSLDPFDLVIVDSPPPDRLLARALADYIAQGGNALFLSDAIDDLPAFNACYGDLLPAPAVSFEGRSGSTLSLFAITGVDARHPLFRRYDGLDFSLSDFRFFRILTVDAGRMAKGARVTAEFSKGLPALLERLHPSGGRVLHFLSGFSGKTSTAAHSLQFVPFLQELSRNLRRASPLLAAADVECGERAIFTPARDGIGEATLLDRDGRRVPLAADLSNGTPRLVSPPLPRPGLYRAEVRLGASPAVAQVAVRTPVDESRLEYVAAASVAPAGSAVAGDAAAEAAGVRLARVERNGLLLALVFLLLVAETLLVQRADKDAA